MYNQIKEVRALIYINAPIRETNRYTRSISFSVFRYFNNARKKIFASFFLKRPKRLLRNLLKIDSPIATYLFFSITIYFFILKYELFYKKKPFFINAFSKKRVLKLLRKGAVNEDLVHRTKDQLITKYKSKVRSLIYRP